MIEFTILVLHDSNFTIIFGLSSQSFKKLMPQSLITFTRRYMKVLL